jgi:hypothetical protein
MLKSSLYATKHLPLEGASSLPASAIISVFGRVQAVVSECCITP